MKCVPVGRIIIVLVEEPTKRPGPQHRAYGMEGTHRPRPDAEDLFFLVSQEDKSSAKKERAKLNTPREWASFKYSLSNIHILMDGTWVWDCQRTSCRLLYRWCRYVDSRDSGLTRTGGSNHIRCLFPAHKVTCSSSSGDNWETSSTGAFHWCTRRAFASLSCSNKYTVHLLLFLSYSLHATYSRPTSLILNSSP